MTAAVVVVEGRPVGDSTKPMPSHSSQKMRQATIASSLI